MRESPSGAPVPVKVGKFTSGTPIGAHDVATLVVNVSAPTTSLVIAGLNNSSPPPAGLVFPSGYMLAPNQAVVVLQNITANPISLADDLFVNVMVIPID